MRDEFINHLRKMEYHNSNPEAIVDAANANLRALSDNMVDGKPLSQHFDMLCLTNAEHEQVALIVLMGICAGATLGSLPRIALEAARLPDEEILKAWLAAMEIV